MLILLSTVAFAACEVALTGAGVTTLVEAADDALEQDDLLAHGEALKAFRERVVCLEEPLSPRDWADFLVRLAVVENALGREWRAPLITALTVHPEVSRNFGPDDIQTFPQPRPDRTHYVPLADDAEFYLDGQRVRSVPPSDLPGPHVAQSFADGRWDTRYLLDEPYPSNWLAPEPLQAVVVDKEPSKKPRVALILGGSLASLGTGLAVGTAAYATGQTEVTHQAEAQLTAANVAGWSAAGVGAGLVVLSITGSKKVSIGAGPRGVTLSGVLR